MSRKNNFLIIGLLVFTNASAQIEQYDYKKSLSGITDTWHQIMVDDDVIGATAQNLDDIRIFGVTAAGDTVEAPYLLQVLSEEVERHGVSFNRINTSSIGQSHFFTFEITTAKPIDEIELVFEKSNFDWRVKLEGSQNQKEWFTVLDDYRILSIKNDLTDYQFTKLKFPSSNYSYFRLKVVSTDQPILRSARINSLHITEGELKEYKIKKVETELLNQSNQTQIDVAFDRPVRLSMIELNVADSFEYYRPVQIKFLSDSIKTEKGWIYTHRGLTDGTLNSLESNIFKFPSTTVKKLRILIDDHDNMPLNIDELTARGFIHRLVARFTVDADYYLAYGNKNSKRPNYDISRFEKNIPKRIEQLSLGREVLLHKPDRHKREPLLTHNVWLWIILLPGIAVIVWFSLKMLKEKE